MNLKRIITGITIASTPIIVGCLINLFIDSAVAAKELENIRSEFLRTVLRIDKRLDRIEIKLDERN